jgi:cellulose synthase/poly-beta-1,6-N-acetylglucosamine synthase-like glycosyltransferase
MGADGSIFSIRRSLYPSFPDTVLDDMTVSMSVVFALYRLIKVDDVIAYERLVAASSEEFRRKIRIATRAFHTHLYLLPQLMKMGHLDKFKYVSHKLIRWFGGAFLLASIISFIGLGASVSLHTGLAAVFSVGLALGLLVAFKEGPIGTLREIIIAMMATLIGVVSAIRGEVLVTWAPAKTR